MSHIYQVPLRVRGYECTTERTVGLPQILSYMEHCRWEWIMEDELGLVDGLHAGCFFVVYRQTVSLARSFGIGTKATVRAALRSVGRVRCEVEQDLVREDGVLLAKAQITAVWLGPNGRPARIPNATREGVTQEVLSSESAHDDLGNPTSFLAPRETSYPVALKRYPLGAVPPETQRTPQRVRPSDCDMFGHVNGSNYLRYFENALGTHCLHADISYKGQAMPGDTLNIHRWAHEAGTALALTRGEQVLCQAVLA